MSDIQNILIVPTFLNGKPIDEQLDIYITDPMFFRIGLKDFIYEKRDHMAWIFLMYENGREVSLLKKTDGTIRDEEGKEVYPDTLFPD